MATCKDCLHYECCSTFESLNLRILLCGDKADKRCGLFKSATKHDAEVKHSMWHLYDDGSGCCKNCNYHQKAVWDMDGWQNYCGHCGAKMDGGDK